LETNGYLHPHRACGSAAGGPAAGSVTRINHFMNKNRIGKILPHFIAVLVFLIVAVLYCRPVFENKVLFQEDVLQWQGMAQSSFQY